MKKRNLSLILIVALILSTFPVYAVQITDSNHYSFSTYPFDIESVKDSKTLYEMKEQIENAYHFGIGSITSYKMPEDTYPKLSPKDLDRMKELYQILEQKAETVVWKDPVEKELFKYNLNMQRLELDLNPIRFYKSTLFYPYMLNMNLHSGSLDTKNLEDALNINLNHFTAFLKRIENHLESEKEKDGYLPYYLSVYGFITLNYYSEAINSFNQEIEGALSTYTTNTSSKQALTSLLEQSKRIKKLVDQSKDYRIANRQTRLDKTYYESLAIPLFTGTFHSPEHISKLGEAEVARIQKEVDVLLDKMGYKGDLSAKIKAFQNDSILYQGEKAIDKFTEIMIYLRGKLHKYFYVNDYPKHMPTIVPKEGYSAYSMYTNEGKSTGQFMPSTSVHPDYTMETLVVHEAVFGHHLDTQRYLMFPKDIPYSQTLSVPSFGEGWALYMEKLAREEGLILTERGYVGSLLGELLRAGRLVADVGINYYNWTDEKAINYLETQTFNERAIEEVNRYNVMPGQALTYKLGELEFVKVRDLLRKELGESFSYLDFHHQILDHGSMPPALFLKAVEPLLHH